jgi:tyrosine-protein kinase Etk/Wzc
MPTLPTDHLKQKSLDNGGDVLDFKQIASSVIKNWYLFIAGIIICVILTVIYTYYAASEWRVSSKILVEDPKNNPSSLTGASSLGADFGSIFNVKSSADNEVQILKSRSLLENTVKGLQLNARIYNKSGLKRTEIYQESPFKLKIDYKADTLFFRTYEVSFLGNGKYSILNGKENIKLTAQVGDTVKLKQYNIIIEPIKGQKLIGDYDIAIESIDKTVLSLSLNFNASLSDKLSSTIDLSLNYSHPKKGEVILEELMRLYLLSSLENKIKTADNTIKFIDGRISLVGSELTGVEKQFEEYQVQNDIADINTQSKVLVNTASEYVDKLNQGETQLKVFREMEKILNDPRNKATIPSSMVAPTDVSFGQGVTIYNNLLIERDKASLAFTENNPVVKNYDQQIETSRRSLLRSVEAYKRNLETSESVLKNQNQNVGLKLKQVPGKERGYLDFQRKQSLKQELYLYLLQKREETAITKTSTISSSRIIDHAKSEYLPYKPQKAIVILFGFLSGLVIPGAFLFIRELLNVKINSKHDVLKKTSIPIVSEIGHNDSNESLVAINNSRTLISEQFRSLRTKLSYLIDSSKSNVILFTSSMGGEGKSFLSINLGSALALTGKKVVFVELDLRKPKLSEIMGQDHNVYGYSNYATSEFTDMNKLIKKTWFDENCSIVSSGPIPPNPTELLTNKKLPLLIEKLKEEFDYVIIDCAPVGLVTDALLIEKYVDLTFYVIRERFTYKSQINIINDLDNNSEVRRLYLILNDIKHKDAGYSSYGYGVTEEPSDWKHKLFNK